MTRYRVGIIGLTDIGCRRPGVSADGGIPVPSSHASAYADIPGAEVVAVCDLQPALLDRFASVWGDVWPNAVRYADHRKLLAEARLDVLSVCTSDHAHAEIVVDACRAGVRGIFCEKPIATTLYDADRMIDAARTAGVVLSIDHTRRWRPLYQEARDQLRAGVIGRVTRVVGTLGGPRAMLFRNGTHLIDTVMMLVDSEAEWVFAELDEGFEDYFAYRGDGGRDPLSDPGVSGYIHFRSGARAFINASKGTPKGFQIDLFGDGGRMSISDATGAVVYRDNAAEQLAIPTRSPVDVAAGVQELIEKLDGSTAPLSCPPELGRDVLLVMLAMLRSQERGNTRVALSEIGS
jgi:predicted dehydrogenase